MYDRESIDRESEREAIAISRHRELTDIDVRKTGRVPYRYQRTSNKEIIEKRLFGGLK